MIDFSHRQFRGGDGDLLIGAGGAVICAEGEINEQHVKTEEAEYRPNANGHGDDARDKSQTPRQSMKMRKPFGLSERCGVIIAEKIFGSTETCAPLLLSSLIVPIIRRPHHPDNSKITASPSHE